MNPSKHQKLQYVSVHTLVTTICIHSYIIDYNMYPAIYKKTTIRICPYIETLTISIRLLIIDYMMYPYIH